MVTPDRPTLLLNRLLLGGLLVAAIGQGACGFGEDTVKAALPAGGDYGVPRLWTRLQDDSINESSGLAASRTRKGLFWTHNDSGPQQLFAVDQSGRTVQRVMVRGVENRDWEDLAAFRHRGTDYLVIADTGDNRSKHESVRLHVLVEPDAGWQEIDVRQTIRFRYPHGPCDCEAVAYDPSSDRFVLITKLTPLEVLRSLRTDSSKVGVRVFAVPFGEDPSNKRTVTAEEIAQLPPTVVTAMDMTTDGSRAVVLTYLGAWLYVRRPTEGWGEAFARQPVSLTMPPLKQPEAICFGAETDDLYLTSEQTPTPLWQVPHLPSRSPTP